jgi:hypothetical protein
MRPRVRGGVHLGKPPSVHVHAHHSLCVFVLWCVCTVMEKYTRNCRFCLICNYVSKIHTALQSRCTKFRFAPLAPEFVRERLQYVIDTEK